MARLVKTIPVIMMIDGIASESDKGSGGPAVKEFLHFLLELTSF